MIRGTTPYQKQGGGIFNLQLWAYTFDHGAKFPWGAEPNSNREIADTRYPVVDRSRFKLLGAFCMGADL